MVVSWTLLAPVPHSRAHESRPLYVEINEVAPREYAVRWKAPPVVREENAPSIELPEDCAIMNGETARPKGARRGSQRYRCAEHLTGRAVVVSYPVFNPSVSTLVRMTSLRGASHTILETPETTVLLIPMTETFGNVATQYLALGVRHILEGYDHLLFLVCLLLIAGTGRRIIITVTGFTIAHSITLALSTLGLISVPVAPVEAAIALSVVFLAVEIARHDDESLTYRYPIAVASVFGLLHGFGFATVLSETGLPQTEIPSALLFFNLGVEVGQLVFVFAAIGAWRLVRGLAERVRREAFGVAAGRSLETVTAYVVGALASFWLIERVAGFWTT